MINSPFAVRYRCGIWLVEVVVFLLVVGRDAHSPFLRIRRKRVLGVELEWVEVLLERRQGTYLISERKRTTGAQIRGVRGGR